MKFEDGVERGATAVLVAISVVVLMGFAAIAVDYGAGVTERRLDQNAADTAALSAGVELIVSGDLQLSVDTAKAFVDDNLNRTLGQTAWDDCADPGALAFPSDELSDITGGSQCISFGANDDGIAFAKIRVRVPDQTTPPIFSRILGFGGLVTDAFAEVQLEGTFGGGGFPAAVFSAAATGESFCVKTGNGSASHESCGDPSTGDFGNFQPYFYEEIAPGGFTSLCRSGAAPGALSRVMADGLDHFLGITESIPGNRINGDDCPQTPTPAFPNRVDSGSGYSSSDITDGLIVGGNYDGSFDGRFTRNEWGTDYGTATIFGFVIDNRPLWSYIDTGILDPLVHDDCINAAKGPDKISGAPGQEAKFLQAQQDLTDCLAGTNAEVPDNLFVEHLYDSPRLTIVPRYHQSVPIGNNSCCYDIMEMVPVFLDAIWTRNGPQWTCDGSMINDTGGGFCMHEPGRVGEIQINASGQRKIDSASAILLTCDILPGVDEPAVKCAKIESGGATIDVFISLFLTR